MMNKTVECSAVANFSIFGETEQYRLFGIETLRTEPVEGEPIRYFLHPRAFDNTTYLNSTYNHEDLVIYYGKTFVNYGIRVLDEACFTRIHKMFDHVADLHVTRINGVKVPLIGEVLYNDEVTQKRWLYGYGYGLGWPYFGWGGYGYGLGLGYGLGYGGLWYGK
jgi:hypothetical protein